MSDLHRDDAPQDPLTTGETAHRGAQPEDPYRIDVHYHHIPPFWLDDPDVRRTMAPQTVERAETWKSAAALEEMDKNLVRTAVTSISNPGIWFGDARRSRDLARASNDYATDLATNHPGRFASLAALPLPDIEGSLAEIEYAYDTVGAVGIGLFTSYDDKWVADEAFAPVFEELNRRRAVVYVHPTAPAEVPPYLPQVPKALLEYPADTTRAIWQWILTGAVDRFPNVSMIFSHAGSSFLSGLPRVELLARTRKDLGIRGDLAEQAARLYYEISSSSDRASLAILKNHVPSSHVLLGTDSPFIGPMDPTISQLADQHMPPEARAGIEFENTLRLLNLP